MRRIHPLTALVLLLLLPLVSAADEAGKTSVTFLPQWVPQAQFAGYFMALEKRYYKEAGLEPIILEGGPQTPPFENLAAGGCTFCTGWLSTAIKLRAEGTPVVNLGQVMQKSALVLVARKIRGIRKVDDLAGKRLGCWEGDFRIQPLALVRMKGLDITFVPMYRTVNLFLKGGVDAIAAMWYNEYHTLLSSGFNPDELSVFHFSDLGLNFPEDGIYCLESTWRADPDLCNQFLKASLKGWFYALEHQDETLEVVLRHAQAAHVGTNRAHQRWMLARMLDLIFPDGDRSGLGRLKANDYARVGHVLRDLQLVEDVPPFETFHPPAALPLASVRSLAPSPLKPVPDDNTNRH